MSYTRHQEQNLSNIFSIFKEVSAAKARAYEAEVRLTKLRQDIADAQKKLTRREEVEAHYEVIVQKNQNLKEDSFQKMQSAIAQIDSFSQEVSAKKEELENLKKEHVKIIKPLQDKTERAKYALERASAEHKTAEKSLNQAKAADLASRKEVSKDMRTQAKAHVEDALVSEKSAAIYLEAAQNEYDEKKKELTEALARTRAQEKEVQEKLYAAQKQVRKQKQHMVKKSQAADSAQKILDETEEIIQTPEETRRLRVFILDHKNAEQLQAKTVAQLKKEAREISSKTRATRFGFIALLVFVCFVIIFIIWMFFALFIKA